MCHALCWADLPTTSGLTCTTPLPVEIITPPLNNEEPQGNLAQGHGAGKQQNQDVNPDSLVPKPICTLPPEIEKNRGKYNCP